MNSTSVTFRFYQELNDFLPPEYKKKKFSYRIKGSPSVKDTIEAIGIPHTEIDLILVNGKSIDFNYKLKDGDSISVYPVFESLDISPIIKLRPEPLRKSKFILDIQLGKLAKKMRMLGFDTQYQNNYTNKQIISFAQKEHRIILTRNKALLKIKSVTHGYWVRNTNSELQLREVLIRFDLKNQINPFSRCMECNGIVKSVNKAEITDNLLPKTKKHYKQFFRCSKCKKIYWKGSHFKKMIDQINSLEIK